MIVGRTDACSSPLDGVDAGDDDDADDDDDDHDGADDDDDDDEDVIHRHGRTAHDDAALTLHNAAGAAQSCPMHVVAGNNQRAFSKRALNTVEAAFEQCDSNARTQTYSFARTLSLSYFYFYSYSYSYLVNLSSTTHLNKHKE
jgi:ABC-type Zn2+ transport system substrate-binding protein/surface adhesin